MRFGIQGGVAGNADNNIDELRGGTQRASDAGLGFWVAELRPFGAGPAPSEPGRWHGWPS
jgi:hypothetical protein